ncbi:hypothetical protein OPQ81_008897 [Rhizoctonia solani]|nr:hypothetical protein OPQ81_008897 [Rhizoctonia solani]
MPELDPNAGNTNPELQPYSTPKSPNNIVGSLDNPTLRVLDNSVVLEDPPEDIEDLIYLRNPSSLAEPKGDEVSALPPVDAKEPHDDKSMGNSKPSKWMPIPIDKAKTMPQQHGTHTGMVHGWNFKPDGQEGDGAG